MSVASRVKKLEDSVGIGKFNVAKELIRLKELHKSGNAPPPRTIADYEELISKCDNTGLIELYEAYIRALE